MGESEQTKFGRLAFEEYRNAVGGETYDKKPIPQWDELPEHIRVAWIAAAFAVVEAYVAMEAKK